MGPFELMDMVGIDVGFEVAKSFNELSFGEPRWKPNPIQERMARGGRHGRKTGRGYYDYSDGEHRPPDPEPLEPGGGENRAITITGSGAVADGLARARAGGRLRGAHRGRRAGRGARARASPRCSCAPTAACARSATPDAVGFNVVPPVEASQLVELTGARNEQVELHWNRLGFHTEWVEDAPGLVLGRIVAQLVNEALFAVGEGVGSPEDVDAGLELGLNHPRGPSAGAGRSASTGCSRRSRESGRSGARSATGRRRCWCAAGRDRPAELGSRAPLVPRDGAAGRRGDARSRRPA